MKEILLPHSEHLPREKIKPKSGIKYKADMLLPHPGHSEREKRAFRALSLILPFEYLSARV